MTMIQSEWKEKHHGRAHAKEEYGHNSEKDGSRQWCQGYFRGACLGAEQS